MTCLDEVNELLARTVQEIQNDPKWGSIEKREFPRLPRLAEEEMTNIINLVSTGKTIAYDGIADVLFLNEKNRKGDMKSDCPKALTIKKLRNLWRVDLDKYLTENDTWSSRLVALNKVFPRDPTRTQLRPIIVQNPLIKLLEARFLPKLQRYLREKLHRSQVGFIPKMGIHVNLQRALERISLRTKASRPCYGLFIDFSNAYNSVPQTLLFQKLRKINIFEEEEIIFLEQLYNRYRIRVGNIIFSTNKGVAQGSLISPSLFNIFLEDLAIELQEKADINLEDLLLYADDILTICSSVAQLELAITIIESWCERNGMSLNKKKSGIVVFAPRRSKNIPFMKAVEEVSQEKKQNKGCKKCKWLPATKHILEIPICEEYKYLGTWLNTKLTCGPQINFIKKKTGFLFVRLYSYLVQASADGRRDMFMTMVAPLFHAAHILLHSEPSLAQRNNLEALWRITFKRFLLISKRTNSILINEMIGKDLKDLAYETYFNSKAKWTSRKLFGEPTNHGETWRDNKLRAVPNCWCKLINTMVLPCPACRVKGVMMAS